MDIWVYTFRQQFNNIIDELAESLTLQKIRTHKEISNSIEEINDIFKAPAIYFFDEINLPVLEHIQRISRFGQERLLGIASSKKILDNGNIWKILQAGATDVLVLPKQKQTLFHHVAMHIKRWFSVDNILNSDLVRKNLIGESTIWRTTLKQIIEVTYFTDSPILVLGETGSGKEMIARLIQTIDPRLKTKKLITLDCTTIVPELSGSEFFGHEKGAFTGAQNIRDGAFAIANEGTLFLDEVGELPIQMQSQLLRVIQEHQYKRVGGNKWFETDFRLVSATNKNLEQAVNCGDFRSDLYYRIAGWICKLPPLRERTEDILMLTKNFLSELRPDHQCPEIDDYLSQYLTRREYPGNIRELKQLITRINARYVGAGPVTLGALPEDERPENMDDYTTWRDNQFEQDIRKALTYGAGLKEISQYASETAINIAVSNEEGNLQKAAKVLGVTDRALQMRRANRRS